MRFFVNVDHVATVRQARRTDEPDPVAAAIACERAGADGITVHLREDRRHILDNDLKRLCAAIAQFQQRLRSNRRKLGNVSNQINEFLN